MAIIKSKLLEKEHHIRLYFYLMISAGLRIGEAILLRSQDFDIIQGKLVANLPWAKGNKTRTVVFVDQETLPFIVDYIESGQFGMVSMRTIQGHAQKMSEELGIPFSCHSFRHYFATKLLSQGVRIDIIQTLLGHTSIETTRVYAHTVVDDYLYLGGNVYDRKL